MLRCVAGRVHHFKAQVANVEGRLVAQQHVAVAVQIAVLPVSASLVGQQQRRSGALGQLARAGDEVGVDVCLGGRDNAHPLLLGRAEVRFDIARRVQHNGFAGRLATHEVGRLSQLIVVKVA